MNATRTSLRIGLLALATVGLLAQGCQPEKADKGPELPPISSMKADLSLFTQGGTASGALTDDDGGAAAPAAGQKANFNNAALRVGVLNLWLALAVTPPAAVFAAALSADATFDAGTWIWDFEAKAGGHTYGAKLSGFFDGGGETGIWLNLKMEVTCTACKVPTEDYLWYEGRFRADGTQGHWQFFNPKITVTDQSSVRIEYVVTDEEHKTLSVTNNRADGHENAGDVIAYERDGDSVSVSVHDESKAVDYAAEASVLTGAGWLEVPGYNDGARACWDGDRKNVDCE